MDETIHLDIAYNETVAIHLISAKELDLLESMLPELVQLAQRLDDSDDD